jgi:RNA polymerase sigma-70 factor, ECF subfamily
MIRGRMQGRGGAMAEPPGAVVYRLPERFEYFYEREYHGVVSLGYALTGSWPAAEDIAQEAFLAAHQAWERIGRYEQPGAWVRRVAANRATSLGRHRLAEARALLRLAARRPVAAEAAEAEEAADFWRAVRALPRRQAQAVALFYLEGWPSAQIAVVLGCSDATVRAHLHKGRLALARRLRVEPGGEA